MKLKLRQRQRKAKPEKLPGAGALIKAALRNYRHHWKRYVAILSIVAVPTNVLSLFAFVTQDPSVNAYFSFAAIAMNIALLWAMVNHEKTGQLPGVRQSYYEGSVALIRFIIVTFDIVLMLIPAALGLSLLGILLAATGNVGVPLVEQILVAAVALALCAPSAYLVIRNGFAPFAVVRDQLSPIEALRRSRRYTRGRFWVITGRLVLLVLFLALLSIPASLITFFLALLRAPALASAFFSLAVTLVALPLGNLYMLDLYREMEAKTPPPEPTA